MNPAYKLAAIAHAALAVGARTTVSADCKLLQMAEFHVDPHSRTPVVDASSNGHPVKVLFDTGSNFSFVPTSEALRLGLILQPLVEHAYGVGGQSDVYSTQIRELKIDRFVKPNLVVQATGDRTSHADVSLVLGDDFFGQVDTEFDLPHGVARLFEPQGCTPPQLVYWGAQGYSQAQLLPWDSRAPATEAEAYLNGRRLLALLDSGAFESTVDDRFPSGLGVHAPTEPGAAESVHGFTRAGAASWIGDFDGFALGDEKVGHVRLRVLDLIGGYKYEDTGTRIAESAAAEDTPAMLIGADFLHAHRVWWT